MEVEDDESIQEGGKEDLETDAGSEADPSRQGVDEAYIHVFLLKYICPTPDCGGTMAPLLGTDKAECNMCSHVRSEQDFMEEMKQYY